MSAGPVHHTSGDPFLAGGISYSRYLLTARIGAGGMAEVFRALVKGPEGFERELVLKRILPRYSGNAQFVSMFVNEAKICALLTHPNIVQIYEFGEAEGTYFIAMENVHGVSLRDAMAKLRERSETLPYMVAADIARQICLGLDYAHTLTAPDGTPLEIIHRDISPPNIMLAFNGTAKVVDFGIARAASFAEAEIKSGVIKGKVSYLAPEQINRQPMDGRVDVFATGILLHEMLTGQKLFQANNELGKMRALLTQTTPPPSSVNASIPRELDRIVLRALERDRERRYPSAAAMANDLERTLIAHRTSSRELARLLHELYRTPEDTPIIIDEDQPTTIEPSKPAPAARPEGTEPSVTSSFRGAGSAERSRLLRARWRPRLRVVVILGLIGLCGWFAVDAWNKHAATLWKTYGAPILHPPRPAPAPPAAEPTPSAPTTAGPPATPAKTPPAPVRRPKRPKPAPTSE
jgi:eukaryotic-like serine/threonine-protein kinase